MLKEIFYKFNSLFLVLKRLYHPTRGTLVLNIHKISNFYIACGTSATRKYNVMNIKKIKISKKCILNFQLVI